MSNTWYDKILTRVGKGLLNLDALTNPKIIALEDSKYTFSQGHEYLSDIPADAIIATTSLVDHSFGGDLFLPEDAVAHWDMGTITGGKSYTYDNITEGVAIGVEIVPINDTNYVEGVAIGVEIVAINDTNYVEGVAIGVEITDAYWT